MKKQIIIAFKMLLVMSVITGLAYPLIITGIAQVSFHHKANGSLVEKDGKIIGSELLGQKFDSTIYFWPRPSAVDYNPLPSGGSNYGPTSIVLKKQITERRTRFAKANDVKDTAVIPAEMLLASASGLDPHISPKAALMQVNRIVAARGFDDARHKQLLRLIHDRTEKLQFGLLGEERINVFLLNLALDKIK